MNEKSQYFKNAKPWSEEIKSLIGLPRPFFIVPKEKQKKRNQLFKNNFFLHPLVPIPWQSIPVDSKTDNILILNVENEKKVISDNLCTYCGIKFNNKDICIRWLDISENASHKHGPRVFSDNHPLHLRCMVEARIFCPFMRKLKKYDFEIGEYETLRLNFEKSYNDIIKENK